MATARPRQVTRYYCSACGRGWQQKASAERHAARCWRDPDNRACPTCAHWDSRKYYYEPDTGYSEGPHCRLGCTDPEESNLYLDHCKSWQAAKPEEPR